jgi:hypothetical protein
MSTETVTHEHEHCEHKHSHHHNNGGSAVYGLGFIGAAIYFIGQATTFWLGVLGFLKAVVWPVFLVLGLMKFIGL